MSKLSLKNQLSFAAIASQAQLQLIQKDKTVGKHRNPIVPLVALPVIMLAAILIPGLTTKPLLEDSRGITLEELRTNVAIEPGHF